MVGVVSVMGVVPPVVSGMPTVRVVGLVDGGQAAAAGGHGLWRVSTSRPRAYQAAQVLRGRARRCGGGDGRRVVRAGRGVGRAGEGIIVRWRRHVGKVMWWSSLVVVNGGIGVGSGCLC